jgi:hypothetical protein
LRLGPSSCNFLKNALIREEIAIFFIFTSEWLKWVSSHNIECHISPLWSYDMSTSTGTSLWFWKQSACVNKKVRVLLCYKVH